MIDQRILKELRGIVGKQHVLTAPEDLVAYSYDGTFAEHRPDIVVRPDSTEQVSKVMKVASREAITVVPRGMASGLAAASVPIHGGMALDTCRMNRILEIDEVNFAVTAEAGVITQTLADTVTKKGLFYPPDPSSIKQSTLGGNAACNAGGPRCLKYGVTSDYVRGMTVVLADGRVLKTGGKAIKNVTGYNLTQLFVGSEGTLGVITELILKLLPLPKVARTAKAVFPKLADASRCVNAILAVGITPATIELMDETTIATIEEAMHLSLPLDVEAILIIESDGTRRQWCKRSRPLPTSAGRRVRAMWTLPATKRNAPLCGLRGAPSAPRWPGGHQTSWVRTFRCRAAPYRKPWRQSRRSRANMTSPSPFSATPAMATCTPTSSLTSATRCRWRR